MLMRDERLATLETKFDDATETLTIFRDGKQVARGQLATPLGRQLIEQFIAAYMKSELRGAPKIVHAAGHSFSDVAAKCVHIVNLASVRELERVLGRPGRSAALPRQSLPRGGAALGRVRLARQGAADRPGRLSVFARTSRCEATNVDPATGARDMAIPAHLMRTWGHQDFGIYAKVVSGRTTSLSARRLLCRRTTSASAHQSRGGSSLPGDAASSLSLRDRRTGRRRNSGCSWAAEGSARAGAALAACRFRRLLLALRRRRAVLALAVLVAVPIAILVAIPIAEAAMVAAEGPVMPAAALVAVARLVASVLARRRLGCCVRQRRLKAVVEPLFPVVVAELVADVTGLGRPAHALAIAVGHRRPAAAAARDRP